MKKKQKKANEGRTWWWRKCTVQVKEHAYVHRKHLTLKPLIRYRANSVNSFRSLICVSSNLCVLFYQRQIAYFLQRITASLLFSQFNYRKYHWRPFRWWNYYCEKHCLITASWYAFEWKQPYEYRPVFEMVFEVYSSFSYHMLVDERGLNYTSFDSHMQSKLLQCGTDSHTLSQVHDTWPETSTSLARFWKKWNNCYCKRRCHFRIFHQKLEDYMFKVFF